jgi:hypothetical protein
MFATRRLTHPAALLFALALVAAACGGDGGDGGGSRDAGPPADARPECIVSEDDPILYMCPCEIADDRCEAGEMCFGFNNKGPHCTHGCSGESDCPAPSGGCGNMNVCRPPG